VAPTDISGFSYGAKNSAGSSGSETSQNESGTPEPVARDESGNAEAAGVGSGDPAKKNFVSDNNNQNSCSNNNNSSNSNNNSNNNNNSNANSQNGGEANAAKSSQESKGTLTRDTLPSHFRCQTLEI
jgi:hypothetical protein